MKKSLIALCFTSFFAAAPLMAEQMKVENLDLIPAANLPTVEAELTVAPNVPKPLERDTPAKVVVKLETLEKVMEIDKGVKFKYWTFNGSTPAPFVPTYKCLYR